MASCLPITRKGGGIEAELARESKQQQQPNLANSKHKNLYWKIKVP
jgi:hypothetical protein